MQVIVPDYYQAFHCTAGACEDTCCAQWEIEVDKASLARYRKVRGPFRKVLFKSIDWHRGVIRQSGERRCAFLNDQNLCDMQRALGADALCKTCRMYPRHVEEFEGVRELSLSLSCPEVARILLGRQEPVRFLCYETEKEETFPDFDLLLYGKLADAREVMLRLLQDRKRSIPVRAGLILGLAHDLNRRVMGRDLFSCEDVFKRYECAKAAAFVERKAQDWAADDARVYDFVREKFAGLYDMEILNGTWYVMLKETEDFLFPDPETYADIRRDFAAWCREKMPDWDIFCEQILVYFIYTYFCGSVYDGKPLAMAQLAVGSLLFIQQVSMARWLKNDRTLDREDVIGIVVSYSREIEHSEKNMRTLETQMEASFL